MKFIKYAVMFFLFSQITAMQNDRDRQPLQLSRYKQKKRLYATPPTADHPSEVVIEVEDIYVYSKKPKKLLDCHSMKESCMGYMRLLIECLFNTNENNMRED